MKKGILIVLGIIFIIFLLFVAIVYEYSDSNNVLNDTINSTFMENKVDNKVEKANNLVNINDILVKNNIVQNTVSVNNIIENTMANNTITGNVISNSVEKQQNTIIENQQEEVEQQVVEEEPEDEPEEEPEEEEEGTDYILNANTKKFHYTWCSSVRKMKESNKIRFTGSRNDVIRRGYQPCKICNP